MKTILNQHEIEAITKRFVAGDTVLQGLIAAAEERVIQAAAKDIADAEQRVVFWKDEAERLRAENAALANSTAAASMADMQAQLTVERGAHSGTKATLASAQNEAADEARQRALSDQAYASAYARAAAAEAESATLRTELDRVRALPTIAPITIPAAYQPPAEIEFEVQYDAADMVRKIIAKAR